MSYLRDIGNQDFDTTKLGVDKELLELLYQVGISAIYRDEIKLATQIFEGLQAVRPKSEYPLLGLALVAFAQKDFNNALDILSEKALGINPNNDIIKAYLALIMNRRGNKDEANTLCQKIISESKEEAAISLAKAVKELD